MPNPAADRQRVILIAVAVTSVALAAVALRAVKAAATVASKPVPTADLQSVSAFLVPLPDSTRFAAGSMRAVVVERDPFGSVGVATIPSVRSRGVASSRPKSGGNQRWVVSSILFEDSRRSAIVNNAWVNVGDPLGGGARLSAIERKHVVVTDANGIRHIVSIQGGEQ